MPTLKIPTPTPPGPGEPRPCATCPTLIIPGKDGAFGEHCRRCQHFLRNNRKPPGKRLRQPPGKPKLRIRSFIHPEMVAALNPELLAAYDVETVGEFLALAGARLLGQPDWEPTKKSAKKTEAAS